MSVQIMLSQLRHPGPVTRWCPMRTAPLLAALFLLASTPARAGDDRPAEPPSGLPWLIAGGVSTAGGVVNLVGAPLCMATLPQPQRMPCAATSVGFGLAFLGAGIPLLVLGAGERQTWQSWYDRVTVAPRREGASVSWRGTF